MSQVTNKFIIRTDRAGVFYAGIASRRGSEADLVDARRIHSWEGATECIGLATSGLSPTSRVTVPASLTVLGVIEVIPCTPKAVASFEACPEWRV